MAALDRHQVIIVCGETGSGKTTQLPKMALALGRGKLNAAPGERGRLIGHTQPRRIAATSVAKRIAQELNTPLGEVVGYKVRFNDTLSKDASIKLMTDGILLAETQTDPLLKAYDTIIIDEAHERSLNIDFLLGYLRQILPKRPDLKVIVTSATIDADRFAQHFGRWVPAQDGDPSAAGEPEGDGHSEGPPRARPAPPEGSERREARERGGKWIPAPVLMVSGRTYPVEHRWRPFEESRDYDLNRAIADGVDELWRGRPGGDVLVFLPGEREIREAADHLRKHLSASPTLRNAEVLPLFARLSQAEQDRVFDSSHVPRIVLATNVAETSLTVPGIRYVIDAGTARVKRYSLRNKVEQLLIEPVSQAAVNQRAGRCGRVADGIAIHLYDEADFNSRPRFTDPEILRSSLAAVILRMMALRLVDQHRRVEDFPFLEAPSSRAITDGYQLLAELGAVDDKLQLTEVGRQLARLPIDPRVGRMLVEAQARGALSEVLVIASALSLQDVRERPIEQQAQADQAHAKFDDEKSEFSGYLRLWTWLHDARGGRAATTRAQMQAQEQGPLVAGPSAGRAGQGKAATASHAGLPAAQRALAHALQQAKSSGVPAGVVDETNASTHKLSNRQYESLLRQNYISVRRVREWRDIHSQLLTTVREARWAMNAQAAGYEAVHLSMLAGLLGNVGWKMEDGATGGAHGQPGAKAAGGRRGFEPDYLGARGIKFHRHPGAHLSKRPGRWIVCAELVETTRLFGRGIANIEPQWIEDVGAHLLRKQVLEPHWEKKAGDVIGLERAVLYGLVIYSGRKVSYSKVDPVEARQIFIRQALVEGEWAEGWERRLPFLQANAKAIAKVESLEHKSRRQDVLVDEQLIYAFYDQQVPEGISNARDFEKWWRQASQANPELLRFSRDDLMRHEAAGITSQAFPATLKLGGVDCTATYLHEPGHARDGLTVTVPLFVLNQVSEARCEWLVPGMLKDKVQALLKSLPQRPRSRFVPLPESAARLAASLSTPERFGDGSLTDVLLKQVREETSLDVKRSDFKLDMVPPHLFMNLRVVDEHGRQLGHGRNLGALKAELGKQARGAFQALAALRVAGQDGQAAPDAATPGAPSRQTQPGNASAAAQGRQQGQPPRAVPGSGAADPAQPGSAGAYSAALAQAVSGEQVYTDWSFGELPELLELKKRGQTLIGFPAVVDAEKAGEGVTLEVFDEPEVAAAQHRLGLRRLFALQVKDAVKYLEKNIPDLQKMGVAYMPLGTGPELARQIIDVALDRAFVLDPLPTDAASFAKRVQDGRGRLTLIAGEVARQTAAILTEYSAAARKIKDTKHAPEATKDAAEQLARLVPKDFLARTPWPQLAHFPRYLKAIVLRLDKYRADPARDAAKLAELRPQEQRYARLLVERKGQVDARMQELRWLLEELRVSFFAQELRTPMPVSIKRLDKVWAQLMQ
ncbi:ATP-dependent helicase [Comamonas serinivorans]|uniref:ATP-dependent helicase n=2 Tax=Comamonas serinivorans TaxID=1082851 RepID=A0A1Y0ETP1_9BURK|nr:ATP-dependent helicase [Comamonas serinivorans]